MTTFNSHRVDAEDIGLTYSEALEIRKNNQGSVFDVIAAAYKLGHDKAEKKYGRRAANGVSGY